MRIKIFITVKTYPTLSEKYHELACTAGITESGEWIRIYPIPFRLLEEKFQYHKYQWIEVDIEKRGADTRPESYSIPNINTIILLEEVSTQNNWQARKDIIFKNQKVYTNLTHIIKCAHKNLLSLVIFKPKKILDFIIEEVEPDWPPDKIHNYINNINQKALFDEKPEDFKLLRKLPKKFSYRFLDDNDRESTLMIEDWEIGQLYWNCTKKNTPSDEAVQKVKQKYFNEFTKKKDIFLFLGTTMEWHRRKAKNPFVIIGIFYPPNGHPDLFDTINI